MKNVLKEPRLSALESFIKSLLRAGVREHDMVIKEVRCVTDQFDDETIISMLLAQDGQEWDGIEDVPSLFKRPNITRH